MNLLFIQIRALSLLIQSSKIVYHNSDESKIYTFISYRIVSLIHTIQKGGVISMGEGIGCGI
jgi:hypothetical protein